MTDVVSLLATTEAFAMALLADAIGNGKDGAKPPLSERTAALKAVTSFLAVQNKLEPPPDDKESEVAEFQRQLAQNDPRLPSVERVGIEEIPSRRTKPSLVMPPESAEPQSSTAEPYISRSVFRALATVFAARLLILLALTGAFVLAVMAMLAGTPLHLWILIAYCALTIGPLVALDLLSRR